MVPDSDSGEVIGNFAMPDEYEDLVESLDLHTQRFTMVPALWDGYQEHHSLDWQSVKFDKDSLDERREDLESWVGIYTLVVMSNVAGHPHCNYLVYVGKTEDQNFYARWRQHLRLPSLKKPKQARLRNFLKLWGDRMWAFFAPIPADGPIDACEQELMKAWVPPANDQLPGLLRQARNAFD